MNNNIRAIQFIYEKYPHIKSKNKNELQANRRFLKEVVNFFESAGDEKISLEKKLELNNIIDSLTGDEFKVAVKASLIFKGELEYPLEYPTDIKNHSNIDGDYLNEYLS